MEYFDYIMIALGIVLIICTIGSVYSCSKVHSGLREYGKYGLKLFDEPIDNDDFEDIACLRAIQALGEDGALVQVITRDAEGDYHNGLNAYIHHKPQKPYYDEQLITLPRGTRMVQVGVYRYVSVNDAMHTVPAIDFSGSDVEETKEQQAQNIANGGIKV